MSIDMISFVGVDETTDLSHLYTLAMNSDTKLEFGVLYSESRKGKRYVSLDFVRKFSEIVNPPYSKSLHICGDAAIKFINNDLQLLSDLWLYGFDAVQLNFSMDKVDLTPKEILMQLSSLFYRSDISVPTIILQANKSKKDLIDAVEMSEEFINNEYFRLLYDGSGGFGRVINTIEKPFKNIYTGYAGGLSPDNVLHIGKQIELISGMTSVYIDMESGVREQDFFSTKKCMQVIEKVNEIKKNSIWGCVG